MTYKIPQPVYQKLLVDMADGIDDGITETLTTETSIHDITHNAKFSTFTMTVNRAEFEGSPPAGFVAFGLGIQSMIYQSFDGVAEADRRVVVSYVDGSTGEEFGSYPLPDALQK